MYEAKITYLTFLEDVLSEKNSPNILWDPQSAHFGGCTVVADEQYHSSRPTGGAHRQLGFSRNFENVE